MQGVTAQNIPSIQIKFNYNVKVMELIDISASKDVLSRKTLDILNKKGQILFKNKTWYGKLLAANNTNVQIWSKLIFYKGKNMQIFLEKTIYINDW